MWFPGMTFSKAALCRNESIVLLPHSFVYPARAKDDFLTIFPTKTIEYLISGRPILAHTPADCFLTHFLRENDCALVVEQPDVDALTAAIERLRSDASLRRRLVSNALKAAAQFQACRVAREFRGRGLRARRCESPRQPRALTSAVKERAIIGNGSGRASIADITERKVYRLCAAESTARWSRESDCSLG